MNYVAPLRIDFPGSMAVNTTLYKISASGEAGGTVWLSNGEVHGFLWSNGKITQVDLPEASGTMIHGINSEREYCGMVLPKSSTVWGGYAKTW